MVGAEGVRSLAEASGSLVGGGELDDGEGRARDRVEGGGGVGGVVAALFVLDFDESLEQLLVGGIQERRAVGVEFVGEEGAGDEEVAEDGAGGGAFDGGALEREELVLLVGLLLEGVRLGGELREQREEVGLGEREEQALGCCDGALCPRLLGGERGGYVFEERDLSEVRAGEDLAVGLACAGGEDDAALENEEA